MHRQSGGGETLGPLGIKAAGTLFIPPPRFRLLSPQPLFQPTQLLVRLLLLQFAHSNQLLELSFGPVEKVEAVVTALFHLVKHFLFQSVDASPRLSPGELTSGKLLLNLLGGPGKGDPTRRGVVLIERLARIPVVHKTILQTAQVICGGGRGQLLVDDQLLDQLLADLVGALEDVCLIQLLCEQLLFDRGQVRLC